MSEDVTWSSIGLGSKVEAVQIVGPVGVGEVALVVFKTSMPSLDAWQAGFWRRNAESFARARAG